VIESHFGIFALLAVLIFYRDWLPILVAALAIAAHHVLFHVLQHQGYPMFVMAHHGGWTMLRPCLLRGHGDRRPALPGRAQPPGCR
jgi:methyl-accepting chemotaxis protein